MIKIEKEEDLEKYFVKKLKEANIFNHKGNPLGLKGKPDRDVYANVLYHVELKLGKQHGSYYKMTPTQEKWQAQIRQSNAHHVLLTGKDEVDAWLEKIIKMLPNNYINHFE